MIKGFHHAQITIPSGKEEEARQFYCGVLQLKEIPRPAELKDVKGFWLEVGEQQLHFGIEDGIDRNKSRAHLAYEVDSIEDLRRRLIENGVEIGESISLPGYDRFEFRDPFGNRVEIIKRLE